MNNRRGFMIFVVLVCADDFSPELQTDDDLAKKWLGFRGDSVNSAWRATRHPKLDWRSSKIL
jgi:hypothetical protein